MSRIIIADDDPGFGSMLERVLSQDGHTVELAENGRQALALIRKQPPDMLICDVIMPDMEGVELLLTLRLEVPKLPTLAISGGGRFGSADYLNLARKAGAREILAKPFTPEQLKVAVEKALSSVQGERA